MPPAPERALARRSARGGTPIAYHRARVGGEPVTIERARVAARGAVQGVGFRPFVHTLARELGLAGWVVNSTGGATVEVEGPREAVAAFLARLPEELPPPGFLSALETSFLDPLGHAGFEIRPSVHDGTIDAIVLPDLATCGACVREVFDRSDRRHRYPFTNCTHCGPRFTIIEALPYDRPATTMKRFAMCAACAAEYADPDDRRFHAQPNACAECGPRLALWDVRGDELSSADDALAGAVEAIRDGRIVAIKGLGGFHLVCDARDEAAVCTLRQRKHRLEKPLAVLAPDLATLARLCEVAEAEARLLASPQAPIVLLERAGRGAGEVAASVAPGNPCLGAMLPMTPLHHLLMRELGFAVVATSGNLSDEPICTDEREAVRRLAGIADLFLVHDRPIVRHVDDSVVRVVLGRELVIRRARGYAPLPIGLEPAPGAARPPTVLAVGAHLKNTVALAVNDQAFVSQHVGDLETAEALAAFRDVIASLEGLYRAPPAITVADLHPDYLSTQHALAGDAPVLRVQHHVAHVASCVAENQLDGPVLGVAWDGTGLGPDGTIWGGELLVVDGAGFRRVAALRPFRLPGGDSAAREPRRAALGVLHAMFGAWALDRHELPPIAAFEAGERAVLGAALERGLHAPLTTSAGRLFDAAASLAGIRQRASFEGQAAMELEWACRGGGQGAYPMPLVEWAGGAGPFAPTWMLDWSPLVEALLDDRARGVETATIARRFHAALANAVVVAAQRIGEGRVALSGGCFQNRVLLESVVAGLRRAGHRPYWHQRVPPNDGGLALGQVALARRLARD